MVPPQFSMRNAYPHSGTENIPYRDNGRNRRCLLDKSFNMLLLGGIRKIFDAGLHRTRLAVREDDFVLVPSHCICPKYTISVMGCQELFCKMTKNDWHVFGEIAFSLHLPKTILLSNCRRLYVPAVVTFAAKMRRARKIT